MPLQADAEEGVRECLVWLAECGATIVGEATADLAIDCKVGEGGKEGRKEGEVDVPAGGMWREEGRGGKQRIRAHSKRAQGCNTT